MGIKIEKTTNASLQLKLISVKDSAIDWAASYPDEAELAQKKAVYQNEYDLQKLVFVEGEKPTLFVFRHPKRVDVSRKIRGIFSQQINGQAQQDLFTEIWNTSFVGTEEGLDGGALVEADRRGNRITDNFFQALEDSGVFEELAAAFCRIANNDRTSEEARSKK